MNAIVSWQLANLLVATALAPIVWLASWLLRRRPAVGHMLWFLLLLKLVLPPVGQWPWSVADLVQTIGAPTPLAMSSTEEMNANPRKDAPQAASRGALSSASAGVSLARRPQTPQDDAATLAPDTRRAVGWDYVSSDFLRRSSDKWTTAVLAAWFLGSAVAAAILLVRLSQQRRLMRDVVAAPHHLVAAVHRVAAQFGVRPPPVALSRRLSGPVVCCAARPRLLWPHTLAERAHVAQCDGVLAHELAHLARRDHWLLRIELMATVCCWWNPLLWFIRRRLHETRELACDARALAAADLQRDAYARKLLTLSAATSRSLVLAPAFGAGTVSRRFLQRRLTMVFDDRVRGRVSVPGCMGGLLLALVGLPGLTWAETPPDGAGDSAASATDSSDDGVGVLPFGSVDVSASDGAATQSAGSSDATETVSFGSTHSAPANFPETTATGAVASLRRQWQSSNVVPGRELESEQGREILFPGGGKVRITRDASGNLVVRIEQTASAPSGDPDNRSTALGRLSGRTSRATASSPYAAPGGGAPSTESRYGATIDPDRQSDRRYDDDMGRLEIELAKVDLEEERIELERIMQLNEKEAVEASRLKLAQLAVRRAEIVLQQAELQLRRQPRIR